MLLFLDNLKSCLCCAGSEPVHVRADVWEAVRFHRIFSMFPKKDEPRGARTLQFNLFSFFCKSRYSVLCLICWLVLREPENLCCFLESRSPRYSCGNPDLKAEIADVKWWRHEPEGHHGDHKQPSTQHPAAGVLWSLGLSIKIISPSSIIFHIFLFMKARNLAEIHRCLSCCFS